MPPIPLAQASAMLRAMAQTAGQNLEARVVGQLPNGMTQVQIGRQLTSLQLPMPQPAGTTLMLAVQQAEGQVRVTLVSAQPSSAPAGNVPAPPTPAQAPATQVQLSAAALSGQAPPPAGSAATPQTAPPQPMPGAAASNASPAAGRPIAAPSAGPQPAPAGNAATPPATERAPPPVNAPASAPAIAARPVIPYAVAAPAAAPAPPANVSGSAANALPPMAQSIATGHVGQHAPPPNVPAPAGPATPVQASIPPAPANPQAALTQMVQQALARQDSVVGLTTALTGIIGRVALPEPVVKAAQQVLAQRLSLDNGGPDGAALQKAIRNSGIFQEAMLAGGQAKAAGGDMKSALLGLQRQLGAWLGDQPALEQVRALPPPLRGMTPRARGGDAPMADLPDDPQAAGKVLLERTEAALSRLRLHQNASLPEPSTRHEAQWSLDLPVTLAGQQSLLHMQISRDRESDDPEQSGDRGWQVRFAINLSDMGEVGAQISLRGTAAGILLWADRAEIASLLDEGVGALRQDLESASLSAGAIVVRAGAPNAPASPAASSGHILDAVR